MGCSCVPLDVNFGDFTGEALPIFCANIRLYFQSLFYFWQKRQDHPLELYQLGDFHW